MVVRAVSAIAGSLFDDQVDRCAGGVLRAGTSRGNDMKHQRRTSARTGIAVSVLALLTLIAASCAPAPPPPIEFDSAATGTIEINVFVPGDPNADPPTEDQTIPVLIPVTGQAVGSWSGETPGPFNVNLSFNDGSFPLAVPGVGTLAISYKIGGVAAGAGAFDPLTGVGGFDTSIAITVSEVDILGPIGQPCDLNFGMSLDGQIDPGTGALDVSQDGFAVTPPAETDCGGLGGLFGQLLGGPDNSVHLSFPVGTFPPPAEPVA